MQAIGLKSIRTASVAALLAAVAPAGLANAQSTPPIVEPGTAKSVSVPFAPPYSAPAPPVDAQTPDSNVWNWQDVPKNEQIVIDRAVFDQGGYRLYCHTGETILVPFVDQNLYVMRFGRSDGPAYFTTDGTTPILYLPLYGYLENADVKDAKWYPLAPTYDYTVPVYASPAPNWSAYSTMGWYPGMVCFGGYVGNAPVAFGVTLLPTPGWFISIDGWEIDSWQRYSDYTVAHPAQRINMQATPAYRYDRFPHRGPARVGVGRPFGGSSYERPAGTDRIPHSGGFANPAFHAHVDAKLVPTVASHLANPNLAQPATAAAVQLTTLKTRPILLGNPRFGNHSAMATPSVASARSVLDAGSATSVLDRLPTTSVLGMATHKSFLDKPGTPTGERSPLWSDKIYRDGSSHGSQGRKSPHAGGLFQKAFKSASTLVHNYAKSSGGSSGSGHGVDHSGHSEKASRSSSGSSGSSGGGGKKK